MNTHYLIPLVVGAVIIGTVPLFNHYIIDNMNCVALENNLNLERWGEEFYAYEPHLQTEFTERCSNGNWQRYSSDKVPRI